MTLRRYVNDREVTFPGYAEIVDDGQGRGPTTRTLVATPGEMYEITASDPTLPIPPPPVSDWEDVHLDTNAAPGQEERRPKSERTTKEKR